MVAGARVQTRNEVQLGGPAQPQGSANNKMKKVIVVIPTLNEQEGLSFVLDNLGQALCSYNYSILVVDGRSSDHTVKTAKDKGALVIFQRSKGYGDALRTGFAYAIGKLGADVIVMIDADGTYDPRDVPSMLSPVLENRADMTIGNRFDGMDGEAMPLINIIGNRMLSLAARLILQIDVSDTQCGLRAISSDIARKVTTEADGMPFAIEMLARIKKAGARVSEVPISYHERRGFSKLNRFEDGFSILRKILTESARAFS